jgi:hypothetical protein
MGIEEVEPVCRKSIVSGNRPWADLEQAGEDKTGYKNSFPTIVFPLSDDLAIR